jgi:hypothetical protein
MGMGPKQRAQDAIWEQPDAELVCLLCGAVVGETYGQRVEHRANCSEPLTWQGGRPRCCQCGGPLICDPTTDVWGAGTRPAARLREARTAAR